MRGVWIGTSLIAAVVLAAAVGAMALRSGATDPAGSADPADALREPATHSRTEDSSRRRETRRRRANDRAEELPGRETPSPPAPTTTLVLPELTVAAGETRTLPAGRVHVSGDVVVRGTLLAGDTILVPDGDDQSLEGKLIATRIDMTRGIKRLRGAFGTHSRKNAKPGEAGLYVRPDATLIIEAGSKWDTRAAYGFQIAGDLVIQGGEFHCRFFNGNGTDRGERSWLPGSTLTVYSGKFIAGGDADFGEAEITIHDGVVQIDDDIWRSGSVLTILGGELRNSSRGGAFVLSGRVDMRDGMINVNQSKWRGRHVLESARVHCSGGTVVIRGQPVTEEGTGIQLHADATFSTLIIETSSKISDSSAPTASLRIDWRLHILPKQTFRANGRHVETTFVSSDETRELVR